VRCGEVNGMEKGAGKPLCQPDTVPRARRERAGHTHLSLVLAEMADDSQRCHPRKLVLSLASRD
jgi:hypothetical protein